MNHFCFMKDCEHLHVGPSINTGSVPGHKKGIRHLESALSREKMYPSVFRGIQRRARYMVML